MTAKRRGKPLQLLLFALNFLKHPKSVGGLLPSSRFLVDGVLKQIDWSQARVIVEYGAGVGVFTLPPALRETIVRKTHSVLRPKGGFLIYQCSTAVLPYLERVFSQVSRDFELLNIFPTRLFFCAR